MIESSNPEIDVNELMARVRVEATKIAQQDARMQPRGGVETNAMLSAARVIPPPPRPVAVKPVHIKKERLQELLQEARRRTEVSRWIPKFMRGLFRSQGGYNHSILEITSSLIKTNLELSNRVRELSDAQESQNRWLHSLADQRLGDERWMKLAATLLSQLDATMEEMRTEASARFSDLQGQLDRAAEHLRNLQAETGRVSDFQRQLDHAGDHLRNLQTETKRVIDFQEQLERASEDLRNLQTEVSAALIDRTRLQQSLDRLDERQINDATFTKGQLSLHSLFLSRLDNQQSKRASHTLSAPSVDRRQSQLGLHRFDPFYVSFEDRFRGSRTEIKERVQVHLEDISAAGAGTAERPILDIGCGRGEWLELLKEKGLEARGVDFNSGMVARCTERTLDATEAEALEYLSALPENTQGAVTGFHLIEHLPLETLLSLLAETRRVLKPGGIAIFESPNCKNLVVGACNFYSDPTHFKPVFPETAQFMLETQGFEAVEIKYLMPIEGSPFDRSRPAFAEFHDWFYGPRDFAVIGYKPEA